MPSKTCLQLLTFSYNYKKNL